MPGPRSSRRRFLVAAGAAAVPVVSGDSDAAATPHRSLERKWLRRYDAASPGTLVDVAPAHGGGWVLAGTDADRSAGLLLGIGDDGRVEWRRRLAANRDGHIAAVTRTPEGYATFGQTDDSQGWLAFLPAEDGQPGQPRLTEPVDAIGSTVSVRPRIHPHPDGGVVVADGYVPSHTATTRVHAFDVDGSRRWQQIFEDKHILGFFVPFDDGWRVGGISRTASPGWLAALGPDGERRWETTFGEGHDFDVHDAVPAEEGITLAVSYNNMAEDDGLVHLGADRSIRWRRSYDGVRARVLIRTTDGRYAVAGREGNGGVRLTRTRPDGSLLWSVTADEEREGSYEVFGLVERAPDSYLLVGTHEPRTDPTGWALGLNNPEAVVTTSTPSPTITPTQPSPTESPTSTPSPTDTATDTQPGDATASPTPTTTPGFGVLAAVAGVAAGAVGHLLRH